MAGKIIVSLAVLIVGLVFVAPPAHAATPSPYSSLPVEPSSVFFTALQVNGTLDYAEIHNQSSASIDLNGWKLVFEISEGGEVTGACEIVLSDWLRPGSYGLVGEENIIEDDDNYLPFKTSDCEFDINVQTFVSAVYLIDNDEVRDKLILEQSHDNESWVRRLLTQSARTDSFSSDFRTASAWSHNRDQLYTGGWYEGPPADVNGLLILEVVANSKKCSPIDTDLVCGNYIKLYNPTDHEINLADYRLRVGYQGQSVGIANRFTWGQDITPELEEYILPPGEYYMLTKRNDGQPVSVTTAGGFVWIEDIYGVKIYEDTIIEYPDAGSTTKEGWAWAFDGEEWQWTMSPQPYGPNVFLLPPPKVTASANTLVPCRPDQFRNPETNRCKLIASASSTLTPCKPGQERNPATNRCRSVAGASTTLKPCAPGQERNPETNRCRKIVDTSEATHAIDVEDVPTDLSSNLGWWFAGVAGVGAVGYGAYEWRRELAGLFGKAKGLIGK